MRLVACYYAGSANIGDAVCSPFSYWDFGPHDVVRFGQPLPDCGAVIFGGGAIGNRIARVAAVSAARIKIAWGVGETRHGRTRGGPSPSGFTLFGSRDDQQAGAHWVPCASCMSPLFDNVPRPIRESVLYWNRQRPRPDVPLPDMHNEAPFAEVVGFLASAEIVVTNSYHGAYWATLLGRAVIIVDAYSSKLHNFRRKPSYAPGGWESAMSSVARYPDALAECRAANIGFHAKVSEALAA